MPGVGISNISILYQVHLLLNPKKKGHSGSAPPLSEIHSESANKSHKISTPAVTFSTELQQNKSPARLHNLRLSTKTAGMHNTRKLTPYQTHNKITKYRKVKVHPRTGHEGPEGEERYSSTLSLTRR